MQLGSIDDAIALFDDTFTGHRLDRERIIDYIEGQRT
jgi:hypothetical protein